MYAIYFSFTLQIIQSKFYAKSFEQLFAAPENLLEYVVEDNRIDEDSQA